MRGLMKADIRRILKKKSLYVYLVTMVIFFCLMCIEDKPADQISMIHTAMDLLVTLMASIPILTSVFGDELKTGSISVAIGRGLSRPKVIRAKLLECAILLCLLFGIITLVTFGWNAFVEVPLSRRQNLLLLLYIWVDALAALCFIAVTMVFIFLSWSVAVGMLVEVCLVMLSDLLFMSLQEKLDMGFRDVWITGLKNAAITAVATGGPGVQILAMVLGYVLVPYLVTVLVFKRKELDL